MQRVTSAYRAEQKEYLRNESYVWVYLGIVNKEAQANAKSNGTFTSYSSPQSIFKNENFEAYYASAEENFTRVNDTMYFLPRDPELYGLWQGAVTQEILGSITFTFEPYTRLDIKGLTIDFGDYYPTRLRVSNGSVTYTYEYENDSPGQWTCDDIFRETDHITITPLEMVGGRQRLRIHSALMGLGLMFDNNSLISTSWKQECAHISDKLPQKTFSFTVSNLDKKFAADDPHSYVSFLQEQQAVEFDYGRRLDDDSIYVIKGGKLYLKSWSSDDSVAKFTAVGFLDYLSGTYKDGQYYPNGISLWQLAKNVCVDAGIEHYTIDNYLKTLYTHNPLPIEKHKNLLQLISNAAQCIMRETRDGGLEIKSSFEPNLTSITSNSETRYSQIENILNEEQAVGDYATCEKDFSYTDRTQYFIPRLGNNNFINTGYISGSVANASGTFTTNPTITIQWEASWTFFNMNVIFGDAKPLEFIVRAYSFGTLVGTFIQDEIEFDEKVEADFYDVDKIVIEFTKAKPYQRIHVDRLRFGKLTDYQIDYMDMSTTPKAVTAELVRNVNVNYYEFGYGSETKKEGTTKAIIGENTVTFNKALHDYSIAFKDGGSGTLSIVSSGAYFITFNSSRQTEVDISAKEFNITTKSISGELHQKGTDKTASNILIDNFDRANAELRWLGEYFKNDIEYTISYRGEPAIDADDQVYIENKYVERNLVRVGSTQIDTGTGMSMSCKLNARRISYVEPALVDVAIVDESEVY